MTLVSKNRCIYGTCKARNLCVGYFCVGANLLANDGYLLENGRMREATQEEKERLLTEQSEDSDER